MASNYSKKQQELIDKMQAIIADSLKVIATTEASRRAFAHHLLTLLVVANSSASVIMDRLVDSVIPVERALGLPEHWIGE